MTHAEEKPLKKGKNGLNHHVVYEVFAIINAIKFDVILFSTYNVYKNVRQEFKYFHHVFLQVLTSLLIKKN